MVLMLMMARAWMRALEHDTHFAFFYVVVAVLR